MHRSRLAPIIARMDHAAGPSSRLLHNAWLVVLLVGTFQFWAAAHYTVFDDEAFSCRLYTLPLTEMLAHLRDGSDPDPPLYYIIENFWVHAFGVTPIALRLPSIIFFLVGCWCTARAAEAWWGSTAGAPALIITALHPAHLFFGFAARWYALAFCLVAALHWITASVRRARNITKQQALAWGVIAGAAMLTNYFLIAVVALHGSVLVLAIWRTRRWTRTLFAAGVAFIVFIPWSVPFLQTLQTFRDSSPAGSIPATAARLLMVLLTGNLASPRAWWTWIVAGIFGLALLWCIAMHHRWRHPAVWVPLLLLALGIFTRTLIDKYVMTISGLCCVALAGLLARVSSRSSPPAPEGQGHPREQSPSPRGAGAPGSETPTPDHSSMAGTTAARGLADIGDFVKQQQNGQTSRRILQVTLIAMWLTCGAHLVTERYWSSLRWRDPMRAVVADVLSIESIGARVAFVASHPSARYYAALQTGQRATSWQQAWRQQENGGQSPLLLPSAFNERARTANHFDKVITLQTSGFVELPEWQKLNATLEREYDLIAEETCLADPDAELKDRLDPSIHHARHRITIRQWRRR